MRISVTINPKFNGKSIYQEVVGTQWFKLQNLVAELGNHTLQYIQTYINTHAKKEHTGNLAKTMKLDIVAGAGTGAVNWGIGKISELDMFAPYWAIINFGGSSWEGDYHFVPGEFNGKTFQYNPGSKEGLMLPSGVKGIIKPMSYIEATRLQLDRDINIILQSLKANPTGKRGHGWGTGSGGAR